jgi:hypothetical protein
VTQQLRAQQRGRTGGSRRTADQADTMQSSKRLWKNPKSATDEDAAAHALRTKQGSILHATVVLPSVESTNRQRAHMLPMLAKDVFTTSPCKV